MSGPSRHPIVQAWLDGKTDAGGCIADLEAALRKLDSARVGPWQTIVRNYVAAYDAHAAARDRYLESGAAEDDRGFGESIDRQHEAHDALLAAGRAVGTPSEERKQDAFGAAVALLAGTRCPDRNCDNKGSISFYGAGGVLERESCQWCEARAEIVAASQHPVPASTSPVSRQGADNVTRWWMPFPEPQTRRRHIADANGLSLCANGKWTINSNPEPDPHPPCVLCQRAAAKLAASPSNGREHESR